MMVIKTEMDHKIFMRQLEHAEMLTLDIESSGSRKDPLGKTDTLSPFHNKFIGLGLKIDDQPAVYYPMRHRGSEYNWHHKKLVQQLAPFLTGPDAKKIIAHNAKYEQKMFLYHYGIDLNLHFDPMIAHYLSHEKPPHRLKYLGHKYLGIPKWDFDWNAYPYSDEAPVDEMGPYCIQDCEVTYALYKLFSPVMESQFSYVFHQIEMPAIKGFADMELNGITLDKPMLLRICHRLMRRITQLVLEVQKIAGKKLNLNSSRQIADLLFKELAIPYKKRTKEYNDKTGQWREVLKTMAKTPGGKLRANKDTLHEVETSHPIVPKLIEYSRLSQLYSSFIGYQNDPKTGRLHPSFNQLGTSTGRSSSSEPNFQQVPKDSEFSIRSCFLAAEGCKLQNADYSGQELNLLTALCGDNNLMEIYKQGVDPHGYMAVNWVYPDKLTGVNPNDVKKLFPEERNKAKPLFFARTYGAAASKLGVLLGLDKSAGDLLVERYATLFPRVDEFRRRVIDFVRHNGYTVNIDGRVRRFHFASMSAEEQAKFGKEIFWRVSRECGEAINMQIQGVAASMMKQAVARLRKAIVKKKLPIKIIANIHDELMTEAPSEISEEACRIMEKAMIDVPITKLWHKKVIINAEATDAIRWGDFKK